MKQDLISYINNKLLADASKLDYIIKADAPNTLGCLQNATGLVIWSGASDDTIYQDETVNWAFRALHDALHLKTGLGFDVDSEIELGRIQANQYEGILADLIYCEVSLQAKYYKENGIFVANQVEFTKQNLGLTA